MTIIGSGFKTEEDFRIHYLLENLQEGSITARGILFNVMIRILEEIDSGILELKGTKFVLSESDIISLRQILQLNIISTLMMLIEDLVILLEANRIANGDYYSLLDIRSQDVKSTVAETINKSDDVRAKEIKDTLRLVNSIALDVGQRTTEFFINLGNFSVQDWRGMMCYVDSSTLKNENQRDYISSLVESNINSLKDLFNHLRLFRKTHSQVFRRYKHAGLAIRFGLTSKEGTYPHTSKKFNSVSMVFAEKDPLSEPIPLPYSNEVIDSYKFLAVALTNLIKEVAMNKMSCLERQIEGLIPLECYSSKSLSLQQRLILLMIIREFNEDFPVKPDALVTLDNKTGVTKEKVQWYADLDNFLKFAKQNTQLCSHARDQILP